MKPHKDLPAGSQNWAGDVAGQLAKIDELEGIVRRLVNDFGLDYSNPQRGLNTGTAPSVANPVQLKLPSLKDLDIRDAQDGDLLTFDGKRGVWTARAHDSVMLPKTFPEGDPDSYYTPSAATPADTWSTQSTYTNLFLDPGCEAHPEYWVTGTNSNTNTAVAPTLTSTHREGSQALELEFTNTSEFFPLQAAAADSHALPLTTRIVSAWILGRSDGRSVQLGLDFTNSVGSHTVALSATVSAAPGEWQQVWASGNPGSGTLVSCVANIYISDVSTAGPSTVVVDELAAFGPVTAYPDSFNFNGSTPTGDEFSYSWTGTPNNSTSTALQKSRIKTPATFPRGIPIQIIGEGWNAGESITLSDGEGNSALVTADGSGQFDTQMDIAAATPLGNTYIEALGTTSRAAYTDVTVTA